MASSPAAGEEDIEALDSMTQSALILEAQELVSVVFISLLNHHANLSVVVQH